MRGRVFSTLFALMRVGLFVAMALSVPVRSAFGRIDAEWLFSQPTRTVLLFGGVVMIGAGLGILWSLRVLLRNARLGEGMRYLIREASRARRYGSRTDDESGDE